MIHPSNNDLDELEAALSEPDLDNLDVNSERYLRAVRMLRITCHIQQELILESDEDIDASEES